MSQPFEWFFEIIEFLGTIWGLLAWVLGVFLIVILYRVWRVLGKINQICDFMLLHKERFQQVMNAVRRFSETHSRSEPDE